MRTFISLTLFLLGLASFAGAAELGELRAESVWTHAGGGRLVQIVEYARSLLVGEAWSPHDGKAGLYWIPPGEERLYELWTTDSGEDSSFGPSKREYQLIVAQNTQTVGNETRIDFAVWNSVPSGPEFELEEALQRAKKLFTPGGFGWRDVTHGTVQVSRDGHTADFVLDLPARAQIDLRLQSDPGILVSLPDVRHLKHVFGSLEHNLFLSMDGSPYRGGMDTYDYFVTDNSEAYSVKYRRSWIVDARHTVVEFDSGLKFFWPHPGEKETQAYLILPDGEEINVDRFPAIRWTESFFRYLELPTTRYQNVSLRSPCEVFYNPGKIGL